MRRIVFSIILGIVFPIICLTMLGVIAEYIPMRLTVSKFYGQPAPGILLAPFTIPFYFDTFVKEERILPHIFDTFWFRVSTFILWNWILYGTIIYFVLGLFKGFKKQSVSFSETPPRPSTF
jgi:hypothetical protein